MGAVHIEWLGSVAHVMLSRPDRLNAINQDMLVALIDAGRMLERRADCRAIVLSGEGRGFCSGIDLDSPQAASGGDGTAQSALSRRCGLGRARTPFSGRYHLTGPRRRQRVQEYI